MFIFSLVSKNLICWQHADSKLTEASGKRVGVETDRQTDTHTQTSAHRWSSLANLIPSLLLSPIAASQTCLLSLLSTFPFGNGTRKGNILSKMLTCGVQVKVPWHPFSHSTLKMTLLYGKSQASIPTHSNFSAPQGLCVSIKPLKFACRGLVRAGGQRLTRQQRQIWKNTRDTTKENANSLLCCRFPYFRWLPYKLLF